MTRRRLGFYMSTRTLGGAEIQLREIIHGADRDRYDIALFAPQFPEFDAFLELDALPHVRRVDVPVLELGKRRGLPSRDSPPPNTGPTVPHLTPGSRPWQVAREVGLGSTRYAAWYPNDRRIRTALRDHPLDLLHIVNGGYPGAVSAQQIAIAASDTGIPTVMTVCSTPKTIEFIPPLERKIDRQVGASTTFTVPTRNLADVLSERRGIPHAQIRVIPFGVDPAPVPSGVETRTDARDALRIPPGTTVIGMIARMEQAKGFDVLIEALHRLPAHLDAHAVLAGDGEFRAALEAQARDLGLADRVHFVGWLESPGSLYLASDVVALPSDIEGLPFVILEAMAAGRAVVASAVGGIPDVVVDDDTGYLVPPRDPETLADRLARVLQDASLAERLGERARARFNADYTLPNMLANIDALYRELLGA